MNVVETALNGVLRIEPDVFGDQRGYFLETYQRQRYAEAGVACSFVQDNASASVKGVLRGLHLQHPTGQDKLIWVPSGAVFDVAVDVRRGSPTFGQWTGAELSDTNKHQLFIPRGFAHGFCVLSEQAILAYKCSAYYAPGEELSIRWDDPDIGIEWPTAAPTLSAKDEKGVWLKDLPQDQLPAFEG